MPSLNNNDQGSYFAITITLSCNISHNIEEQHTITIRVHQTLQIQLVITYNKGNNNEDYQTITD